MLFRFIISAKTIDFLDIYGKISSICKCDAETKKSVFAQARGEWCEPLAKNSFSHFQAVREDRNGRSRYRATKMPFFGELGWYRERLAPNIGERFIFLYIFMEVESKWLRNLMA